MELSHVLKRNIKINISSVSVLVVTFCIIYNFPLKIKYIIYAVYKKSFTLCMYVNVRIL